MFKFRPWCIMLFVVIASSIGMPADAIAEFKKIKIAVLDFELQGQDHETEDMGAIVAEWLVTALVRKGRFDVIERRLLKKVLSEQQLSVSGAVDEQSASKLGQILGAKTLITGSVVKFQDVIEVNCRIIDVESTSIMAAETIQSTSAIRLEELIAQMAEKIIQDFPLEGYIVFRQGRNLLIDLGRSAGVEKGMKFIAFREGDVIKHPKTGKILDVRQIEIGLLEITQARDNVSEGSVISEIAPDAMQYGVMVKSLGDNQHIEAGTLVVETVPALKQVDIQLLNNDLPFKQGIELFPGTYRLAVQAPGFERTEKSVSISSGENRRITIELKAKAPDNGRLFIDIQPPAANASIDLIDHPAAFKQGMELAPGTYRASLSAEGYQPVTQTIVIEAGQTRRAVVTFKPIQPISSVYTSLEGFVVFRKGRDVVVDLGKASGIAPGMQFAAFGKQDLAKQPASGKPADAKELGVIEIVAVRERLSEGVVVSEARSDAITYGIMVKGLREKRRPQTAHLYVLTNPSAPDAVIKILNIVPRFHQGIELAPGQYHIAVIADGYERAENWVAVAPGEENRVVIDLKAKITTGRLYVETVPPVAANSIKLRDSRFIFNQGVELPAGNYRIHIDAAGFQPQEMPVSIVAGADRRLSVDLVAQPPPTVAGRLYVDTFPAGVNADIKILNIQPRFYQGIELDEGNYHLAVIADGYERVAQWVAIQPGEDRRVSIELVAKAPDIPTGRLYVETVPPVHDGAIKLMNTGQTFKQGMDLPAGAYRIAVDFQGYKPVTFSIDMKADHERRVRVNLQAQASEASAPPIKPQVKAASSTSKPGRLSLQVQPSGANAHVKLLDSDQRFAQGMALAPGNYRLQISASGYRSITETVKIAADDHKRITVKLDADERTGVVKIGIGPFLFKKDAGYLTERIVQAAIRSIDAAGGFEMNYCYYRGGGSASVQSSDGLTNMLSLFSSGGNGVSADSFFSWTGKPDITEIVAFGQKIGVDAILTANISADNRYSDQFTLERVSIYLIDVQTQQILDEKAVGGGSASPDAVVFDETLNALNAYKRKFGLR